MASEAGPSSKDTVEPEELTLYVKLMKFCPYSERIRIILGLKGDPSHMRMCSDDRANFLERNDACKIPYLKYGDNVIYNSLQQADFLDELYPEPPLWNGSPSQKILDKLLLESFGKVETAVHKLFMTTSDIQKDNFDELVACLIPFEHELVKRKSDYFGGDEPNMVDVMMIPWLVFLDAINPYSKGTFVFPFEVNFPRLAAWKASFTDGEVGLGNPSLLAFVITQMKIEFMATWYFKNLWNY